MGRLYFWTTLYPKPMNRLKPKLAGVTTSGTYIDLPNLVEIGSLGESPQWGNTGCTAVQPCCNGHQRFQWGRPYFWTTVCTQPLDRRKPKLARVTRLGNYID